jgi:hypothetical protein
MKRLVTASGIVLLTLALVVGFITFLDNASEATAAPAIARVWVAHLAPFSASVGDTEVTVRINSTDVLTNFKFGDTTGGYVELPATTALVEVVGITGGTVLVSDTYTLTAGTDYTIAAIGDVTGRGKQPLELLVLVDDNTPPPAGQGKVRFAHLAPFAEAVPDTAVDIRTDDGTLVVPNVTYKTVSPYVPLPAGVYGLKITTPGGGLVLADLDPFLLTEGDIIGAFATGDGGNQPVQVLTLVYGPEHRVMVTPATAGKEGSAGTGVSYTLTVSNTGLVTDTFSVDVSGYTWPASSPSSVGPLAAGAGQEIIVSVGIPDGAAVGASDTMTVTVTSQGDSSASDSSVLTTTVKEAPPSGYVLYMPLMLKQ